MCYLKWARYTLKVVFINFWYNTLKIYMTIDISACINSIIASKTCLHVYITSWLQWHVNIAWRAWPGLRQYALCRGINILRISIFFVNQNFKKIQKQAPLRHHGMYPSEISRTQGQPKKNGTTFCAKLWKKGQFSAIFKKTKTVGGPSRMQKCIFLKNSKRGP